MWRHVLVMLVAFVAVAGLWGTWQWRSASAHDRLRADLEAAGMPTTPESFNAQYFPEFPPPDAENAVTDYNAAFAALAGRPPTFAASNLEVPEDIGDYPPFWPEWHATLDVAMADPGNRQALALARSARDRPEVDWGTRVSSPVFMATLTNLNQVRALANLLGDAALFAHVQGDDAEALERLSDLQALSRSLENEPFLISLLVRTGIEALAADRALMIAPRLEIGTRPGEAPPEAVDALIDAYLEDDSWRRLAGAAMDSERLSLLDLVDTSFARTPTLRAVVLSRMDDLVPMYADVAERMAPPDAAATPQGIPPIVESPLQDYEGAAIDPAQLVNVLVGQWVPSFQRVHAMTRSIYCERRMVAIALAMARYRADHGGAWPGTLDELVQAYLPYVPTDLHDPAGGDLGYRMLAWPDGSPRPVLTSVGEDGVADVSATFVEHQPPTTWPDGQPEFANFGFMRHTRGNVRDGTSRDVTTDDEVRDLTLPPTAGPTTRPSDLAG